MSRPIINVPNVIGEDAIQLWAREWDDVVAEYAKINSIGLDQAANELVNIILYGDKDGMEMVE